MRPTGKSVVLDLLSTLRDGSMPVRTLVEAAALFDIGENPLRVALARLVARGLVARDERGRYRLAEGAAALQRTVRRWRALGERVRPWVPGQWIAVLGAPRGARGVGRVTGRALRFLAFRSLAPGVHLRPENLVGGVAAVREELRDLGLPRTVPVAGLDGLDADAEARARRLWDTRALVAGYRDTCTALAASERRLPRLAPAAAMAESFLLGGRAIRQLVLDPLLPEPLVPAAEREAVVAAMRRYDRAGRAAWRAFMRAHDVLPDDRAPMDLRLADEAVRREGAGA